jgi:hypothetical protein
MNMYRRVEVMPDAFITSALDTDEWSTSHKLLYSLAMMQYPCTLSYFVFPTPFTLNILALPNLSWSGDSICAT